MMKSICQCLCLTTLLIAISSIYTIAQLNEFTFERQQCINVPNSSVTITKCTVKSINRTHVNIDVEVKINRTIRSVFVHFVAYLQSSTNEYRYTALNVWEDMCGVLKGVNGNIFSKILYNKIRNYTNANHVCPYGPGLYFFKWKNAAVSLMDINQILPAGRHRIDTNFTEGYNGKVLAMFKTYYSVSDHRLTKF